MSTHSANRIPNNLDWFIFDAYHMEIKILTPKFINQIYVDKLRGPIDWSSKHHHQHCPAARPRLRPHPRSDHCSPCERETESVCVCVCVCACASTHV